MDLSLLQDTPKYKKEILGDFYYSVYLGNAGHQMVTM